MADIERIPQNMAVSKDLLVGGKASVSGDAHVKGSLRVGGWLEADNVKGPMKGLYRTLAGLKSEYPDPQPGWMALVGTTLPAPLYMEKDGEWTDTGNTAGTVVVGLSGLEERLGALESAMTAVQSGLTTANTRIQNLNSLAADASHAMEYVGKKDGPGGPATLDTNGFVPDRFLSEYVADTLSDNTEDIKTLKGDVTGLEGSIRTLEQNQSFDEGELSKLKQRVSALELISG